MLETTREKYEIRVEPKDGEGVKRVFGVGF